MRAADETGSGSIVGGGIKKCSMYWINLKSHQKFMSLWKTTTTSTMSDIQLQHRHFSQAHSANKNYIFICWYMDFPAKYQIYSLLIDVKGFNSLILFN